MKAIISDEKIYFIKFTTCSYCHRILSHLKSLCISSTSYEKQCTQLTVTYRYPILKECNNQWTGYGDSCCCGYTFGKQLGATYRASMENPQPLSLHSPFSITFIQGIIQSHGMESGYFQSNLVSTYHEHGTSHAEANTPGDAGPHLFFYCWSNFDGQLFDPSFRVNHVVTGASDDLVWRCFCWEQWDDGKEHRD